MQLDTESIVRGLLGLASYTAYASLLVACFLNAGDWAMIANARRGLTAPVWWTVAALSEPWSAGHVGRLIARKAFWIVMLPLTLGLIGLAAPISFTSLERAFVRSRGTGSRRVGFATGALMAVSVMTLLNGLNYLRRAQVGIVAPGVSLESQWAIGISGVAMCLYYAWGTWAMRRQSAVELSEA